VAGSLRFGGLRLGVLGSGKMSGQSVGSREFWGNYDVAGMMLLVVVHIKNWLFTDRHCYLLSEHVCLD
jgi:hypothetical protein